MTTFDEALAEVGKGEDVAVDVTRQGLGSPQGQRDGRMDLPEKEVGGGAAVRLRAEVELWGGQWWIGRHWDAARLRCTELDEV